MRKNLFKAKGQTSGRWYEGLLARFDQDVCHIKDNRHKEWICDSKTVCQYTGYEDLRKKKVFEHDIVFCEDGGYQGCIVFRNGCFLIEWESSRPDLRSDIHFWFTERRMYVIGNIFDNTDLDN